MVVVFVLMFFMSLSAGSTVKKLFVTGTDTDIGKTVVCAGLCMAWPAHYWKPVQAGFPTDSEVLGRFIPPQNIHPSAYTLQHPMSPNQAGQRENISVQLKNISLPDYSARLVIEGAGGVLVPLNDDEDMTDLMKAMDCPVVVVARSGLGTLNHTFLTLSVLKKKNIPVLGVVMVGEFHPMNKKDISKKAPVLLELPWLDTLSADALRSYFAKFPFDVPATV